MGHLLKTPTGIAGLDEILKGGLPQGRPTLITGGPGCGKSMLSMEFLCRGARQFSEPGLFISLEESLEDIKENFESCSFGFNEAFNENSIHVESLVQNMGYSVETGEFTLDGLLLRLELLTDKIGAKRLVLDSLSSLFERFSDTVNLRNEISRIFQWIKQKELTAIVTSEANNNQLSQFTLQEYVSDCVILIDHRIREQIAKRRLRILKYRGSSHGLDEYPLLITGKGCFIFPITSVGLESAAPETFISTGVVGLDRMLAGKGFYRGSTVLISGGAGTGKSSLAVNFSHSNCQNGGRSLYLAFEESVGQILRNMRSIGIDLEPYLKNSLLRIKAIRPSTSGLEEHLALIQMTIDEFQPDTVVLDPISSFTPVGNRFEIKALLTRTLDYLKKKGITTLLTNLTPGSGTEEETDTAISSLVDTWIVIRYRRTDGQRKRSIYVHKARGIAHSEDVGELVFSETGISVQPFDLK